MVKKPLATKANEPTAYESFEDLTKKLLAVPKKELDKKVITYNAKKAKKKPKSK